MINIYRSFVVGLGLELNPSGFVVRGPVCVYGARLYTLSEWTAKAVINCTDMEVGPWTLAINMSHDVISAFTDGQRKH